MAERGESLAGLVSLRVESLFGEEKGGRAVGSILRDASRGLPAHQLVKDIGTQLEELNEGESQELIARLVRLLLRGRVARVEEDAEGEVVLVEDGLVELAAPLLGSLSLARAAVGRTKIASGVHVGAAGGTTDRGGRRGAASAPGTARKTVDAHVAAGAARVRGRSEVAATVGIRAVATGVFRHRPVVSTYRDWRERRIATNGAHDGAGEVAEGGFE